MIHSIKGIIQSVDQSCVIIETQGISWLVYASAITLKELSHKTSQKLVVYTWLQITNNAMFLYGFIDTLERELFTALISVSGIGPKGAIKILSNAHFSKIITHIQQKNIAMLIKSAKVSKKKAQSILLKLENTFISSENIIEYSSFQSAESNKNDIREQVVVGLIEMGYTRKHIEDALKNTIDKQEIDLHTHTLSSTLKALIIYLQKGVFSL